MKLIKYRENLFARILNKLKNKIKGGIKMADIANNRRTSWKHNYYLE